MVGLSDIPCVGKAVDKISDFIVDYAFRGLRYMCSYKSFVENLDSQIVKVNIHHADVSRRIEAEKANGKVIKDHVLEWQEKVEESNRRRDELLTQELSCNCFGVMRFPIPLNRLQLGREATHEAKNVAELTASGEKLLANEIAHLPADPNMPICDTTYQKFDSREEAYGKLWEALVKEDGNQLIGIYGMPGVGKTRMMEQAWEDAKKKKIFNKVTRANVGRDNFDVIKLQNELAGYLDCHFESGNNVERRAIQLKNSLSNGGKSLVVLDDVWDRIPLQNIGIPLGADISKCCKILLTSRIEDVCLLNGCEDRIKIEPLKDGEAWDMFRNIVGTSKVESLQDKLAEEVCKECAGLPLVIGAVGNALKFDNEHLWKNALLQLQNHHFDEIEGVEPGVSAGIQLSFDKLGKDTKSCLFLCSVFPEDSEIEIKMLEDFATGSQLLKPGMGVRGLIGKLKSSSLLLEGKTFRTVKLHDIIQDVARCLAAKDKGYAFYFRRGGWSLPDGDDYTTRRLLQFVESDSFRCPNDMVCPYLHTLWLERNNKPPQFPKSFFKGIGNLKILVLKDMDIFPEHMPVRTFNNLNVLILDGCGLDETSLSIIPESLEIIRISDCSIPNPLDLSKLKSLRKLEVVCDEEIEMVKNGISTLPTTLEELHIPRGFRIRDAEGNLSGLVSSELNKLSKLTSLNIRLADSNSCPNENIVANLLDFKIDVGYRRNFHHSLLDIYTRSAVFKHTSIEGGGEVLVERAQELIIDHVKGSQNGFSSNNNIEAYSNLERLDMKSCDDMEHLVAWKAEYEIQQSQPLTSFSKLTQLYIYRCRGLKYLFSASAAECLVQLEELRIWKCPRLEVVIRNERAIDGVIINFPKLKVLKLTDLPSLKSFYGENRGTSSSSTTMTENATTTLPAAGSQTLLDEKVSFPILETLNIAGINTREIWKKNCYTSDSFCPLKSLHIAGCHYLELAIPLTMLPTFQNLENLEIYNCKLMTSEVESSSSECGEPTCAALRSIVFSRMPALTKIWLNSPRNSCPNLETLTINECKSLRNVFSPSIAKHLKHLEILNIRKCEMMNEIIGEEERHEERNYTFDFSKVTELELYSLPHLRSFCFNQSVEASQSHSYLDSKVLFPKLEILEFNVGTIVLDDIKPGTDVMKMVVDCYNKVQLPITTWQLRFPNIEELSLRHCWWSGNINIMEAFLNLKKLSIYSCDDMERLAFIPQYEIHQSQPLTFLSKLTYLHINSCSGFKYLFCASVANCLVQLQELCVENCPALEVIIMNEGTVDGVIINFPKLKELTLANLDSLRRFYEENRDRSSSSSTIIIENAAISPAGSESLFDGTVTFPALETLRIQSLKTSGIWGTICYNDNSFSQLKILCIERCDNLEFAIPLAMLPTFQNLGELKIIKCESMFAIVLNKMPGLTQIGLNTRRRNLYPNLRRLSVFDCKSLESADLYSNAKVVVYFSNAQVEDDE